MCNNLLYCFNSNILSNISIQSWTTHAIITKKFMIWYLPKNKQKDADNCYRFNRQFCSCRKYGLNPSTQCRWYKDYIRKEIIGSRSLPLNTDSCYKLRSRLGRWIKINLELFFRIYRLSLFLFKKFIHTIRNGSIFYHL